MKRQDIRISHAGGFTLRVRPTVFHPKFFISSEKFAEFIDTLDLTGKRVCEVGTGSGILALAAARAGAKLVVATDINPNASLSANENAEANGLGDRVTGVCINLLAGSHLVRASTSSCRARQNTQASRRIARTAAGTQDLPIATSSRCSISPANASRPVAKST